MGSRVKKLFQRKKSTCTTTSKIPSNHIWNALEVAASSLDWEAIFPDILAVRDYAFLLYFRCRTDLGATLLLCIGGCCLCYLTEGLTRETLIFYLVWYTVLISNFVLSKKCDCYLRSSKLLLYTWKSIIIVQCRDYEHPMKAWIREIWAVSAVAWCWGIVSWMFIPRGRSFTQPHDFIADECN